MKRINQLDSNVASQIAAGEVIERPASVVKELLENSLDAGADNIRIDIENGGIGRIKITDNGYGIHHNDLLLSVTPHATSKITSVDDLVVVNSLGFRGEALASIGSIAKMQLISKHAEDCDAKKLVIEGGLAQDPISAAGDLGTTILVEDLFYNVPVRRKFLKSHKTEIIHIDNIIKKTILSRFEKRYQVYYDGKLAYNFSQAYNLLQKEKRIEKIFGRAFMQHAVSLEVEASGITLQGWMCLPSLERRQSDWQYFYLNGRIIRDKLIQHAIRQAFADRLDNNFQPAYVLYLSVDPACVDVNVHPTKHEVRFQDSRYIHDFIVSSLQKVLSDPNAKSISLDHDSLPERASQDVSSMQIVTNKAYEINEHQSCPLGGVLGILKNKFILSENTTGLVVIDIQEMYTHLFYLNLQKTMEEKHFKTLVIPETIAFDDRKARIIEDHIELLRNHGLYIEVLSDATFVIRKANKIYKGIDLKQLLEDTFLLSQQVYTQELLQVELANSRSKQYSSSEELVVEEASKALRDLEKIGCHHVSYRGTSIWRAFSLGQLAEFL